LLKSLKVDACVSTVDGGVLSCTQHTLNDSGRV
jgi:hypothetical protein